VVCFDEYEFNGETNKVENKFFEEFARSIIRNVEQ
jgi:hypothetical protein